MAQPETVAVIRGGDSAEREISLKSGKAVSGALESAPCEVREYDTERRLGERLVEDGVDVAFVALHGRGGEDGVIQGLLEWYDIPYTGPGVEASATGMDKIQCKRVFESLGVPTPDWFVVNPGDAADPELAFDEYVVKPRYEGSSLGMSIVDESDFADAVAEARQYDRDVLVEQRLDGYEVTVGVVGLDNARVLPPVGIRPSHEYFDYETKYTKGLTEYDVPAEVDGATAERLKEITLRVARELGTLSLCRVDFMVTGKGPSLFEINTIPGMTETSLLPKAAEEAGISFEELVWSMVMAAGEEPTWDAA
jgi:D-alanine-D-alanine ligase